MNRLNSCRLWNVQRSFSEATRGGVTDETSMNSGAAAFRKAARARMVRTVREPSERAMDPVSSAADGHGHRWGAVVEPVVAAALPGHCGAECPQRAGARRDIGGPLPPSTVQVGVRGAAP